uniref:Uncharacterized protein n=1 Tax=viral metagenome TaxID=1070528 RepID=A0A6C0B789_9ZZZZ
MIELNLFALLYLFLRLSPFIIVCFFVLNSLFNQDFRGIVYIHGLIASCVVSSLIYTAIPWTESGEKNEICSLTSFSKQPNSRFLPIGQNILGFTFFYLLFTIIKNSLEKANIITLVFFPLLIAFDLIWNVSNSCYSILQLLTSLIIGAGLGTFCSYIIYQTGVTSFQYFYMGDASSETCSIPAKQTFQCNVYKNGALIGSTTH